MRLVVLTLKKKKKSLTSLETNFSLGVAYYGINLITDHLNSKIFGTLLLIQPNLRNVSITYLLACVLGTPRAMVLV